MQPIMGALLQRGQRNGHHKQKHSKCPNPTLYKECTVARNKSFLLHHSTGCAKAKSQLGSSVWSIGSGFPPIAEIHRETSCQKKRCGNEIKGQHIPLDIPRNRQQWPTSSRHMHCSQHTTCHVRPSCTQNESSLGRGN